MNARKFYNADKTAEGRLRRTRSVRKSRSGLSCILKLNDFFVSLFLFVCAELIEELAKATDLKFGMYVEDVVSRNKTKDLSDIATNF